MTDLLTSDHADSGEIPRGETPRFFHDDVVDTAVLDLGQTTRNLSTHARRFPPIQALRLADAHPNAAIDTGELPLWPTGAEVVALQEPGQPRPPAPLPDPPPNPTARPPFYRGVRRAPAPVWARRALLVGLGSVGTVVLELAGIAALAATR